MSEVEKVDDIFAAAAKTAVSAEKPGLPKLPQDKESRKEVRVKVKWPARVQLPNGSVVGMRVCDISENCFGLAGEIGITPNCVRMCAVAVPHLKGPEKIIPIVGTVKTTHATVRGLDLSYGGIWVKSDATSQELFKKWIRRLRG